MTEYLDIRCGDNLDRFARDVLPLEVLAQDVYHWLITDKGSCLGSPDFGLGLSSYISAPLPPTLASDIENGLRRDDRISDAQCAITPVDGQQDTYSIQVVVDVDDNFLTIALQLSPDGIVRVA